MGDSTLGGLFPSGVGNNINSLFSDQSASQLAAQGAAGGAGGANISGTGGTDNISGTGGTSNVSGSGTFSGAPASTGAAPQSGGLLNSIGKLASGITLPQLVSGGGMLASLVKGPGSVPQKGNLQNIAGAEATQGNQLIGSLASGELPAGEDTLVDQQLNAQIAAIQQKYASMGLSGSTMEQQDIANANANATAQRASLANQATQTGMSLLNSADSVYGQLAQAQLTQDQELSNSLAEMMQAFGGGSGATNTKDKNSTLGNLLGQ